LDNPSAFAEGRDHDSAMKSKILLIALLIAGVVIFNFYYPLKDHLNDALDWFRDLGPLGVIPYIAVFVLASVFFIPISGLIIMAGTLYGPWMGFLLAAFSASLSVAVCYAVGKKLWRQRVELLRRDHPRLESVLEAVSKHGNILVVLIRLNPFLPFTVLNYLFTIPKLDPKKYLLCSSLALTPDIFFYLYVGHVGNALLEDPSHIQPLTWVILGLALAASVAAGIILNRLIRKAVPHKPIGLPERAARLG
jgi:uncharacterized membrane protein YdjX (TVP38/TMEM64 family)